MPLPVALVLIFKINVNPFRVFSHKMKGSKYCTLHKIKIGLYGCMNLQKQRNPIPLHFIEHGIEQLK